MEMQQLSPNSVNADPATVNPQVKADQATTILQVNLDAQKTAKVAQTDTVTISPQALKMTAGDGNAATVKPTVYTDSSAKDSGASANQPTDQAEQAGTVAQNTINKNPTDKSSPPVVANGNNVATTGVISHVVVSYNLQGKIRTKFEDTRNNVVYQIPSEMTAKQEDQITTSSTSTNIKG